MPLFQFEQSLLGISAVGEAGEFTIGSQYTVARNDEQ